MYKSIKQKEILSTTVCYLEKRYSDKNLSKINTADCNIYVRGQYWVIEYEGKVIYYEYHQPRYPFFETALHWMNPVKTAKWKTVQNLTSFRQAIREDTVNWRGLTELIEPPLTYKGFIHFMKLSRSADLLHHGQYTF